MPQDVFDFSAQLDYNIEDTEERLKKLRSILEQYDEKTKQYIPAAFFIDYFSNYYNPHLTSSMPTSEKVPTCLGIQYMAGYVIFNKGDSPDDIVKDTTQKDRDSKHVSIQKIVEEGEEKIVQSHPAAKYIQARPRITQQDVEEIPPLQDITRFISSLVEQIDKTKDSQEKYKLRKILIEARQEQYAIKDCYKPYIHFRATKESSTEYDFEEDTGYVDEDGEYKQVSVNTIDFSNPEHIHQLLKHYSALRHEHYDNPHSNMRYVLDTLEQIIDETDLKDLFRRVLICRIDGVTYEDIAEDIYKTYGVKFSIPYLSHSFVKQIPRLIAEQYKKSYSEWYNLNKVRGDYKMCKKCNQNKVRSKENFHVDKGLQDGFKNVCKTCRNKQGG